MSSIATIVLEHEHFITHLFTLQHRIYTNLVMNYWWTIRVDRKHDVTKIVSSHKNNLKNDGPNAKRNFDHVLQGKPFWPFFWIFHFKKSH